MNTTCQFDIEILKNFIQVLTITIGWIIVHKLSTLRDIEKSRRDLLTESINECYAQIDEIIQKANEYHTTERNLSVEKDIKRRIQDLSVRLSSFQDLIESENCYPSWEYMKKFRQSITKHHFEDEHIDPITSDHDQFEEIAEYEMSLKRELVKLKHQRFKFQNHPSLLNRVKNFFK